MARPLLTGHVVLLKFDLGSGAAMRAKLTVLLLGIAAPLAAADVPPDYARADAWAARPGHEGAAAIVAPGATPAARNPAVDVFYVNPTTERSNERWNADPADPVLNAWTDGSVIARQAGIFNACCRIFAPRYRQASRRAFLNMASGGSAAFDLAYTDVLRAFDRYLAHDNHGRPFILVGHSQGARHVQQLLAERIDGKSLARRMVAAYVIGVDLVEGDFGHRYKALKTCDTPSETGCVAAWNSVLPELDRARAAKMNAMRYVTTYGDGPGTTGVCINPLTFDRATPSAPAGASLGAVPGDPDESALKPLVAGKVSAHCEDGYLVVEPDPSLGLKSLPGGSMHYHDFGLFYADIRANAVLRTKAWLAARR